MAEIWDLYDAKGRRTGKTIRRGEEIPAGLYHLVVHIWPINDQGELLIQQRSENVQWKPGMWAVTGGSAISGESAAAAAHRELLEELGYNASPSHLTRIACLRRTNSFCNVYTIQLNCSADAFVLQKEEVSAVKWCSVDTLLHMVSCNTLYNYGDAYFRMLLHHQKTQHSASKVVQASKT